jgi:tetratricopeptide (TPR) repeat protein
MRRSILALLVAGIVGNAQQAEPRQKQLKTQRSEPAAAGKEQDPPEEDKSIAPTEYSFNPLQAAKDIKVGDYYLKRGNVRAAAGRFREATRWNESSGEAWLRLAEAEEKLKDRKAAREAYTKYLEVAADAKNAADIRKKIASLSRDK